MVKTTVAAVGALLTLVGLAMTATIAVIEEWVVVTLPPFAVCDETPLGNLGLYTATFDPSCTQDASVTPAVQATYAGFVKAETATTEFWPLFSSQTGFNGLTTVEFTTCEEFFANPLIFSELAADATFGALVLGSVEASLAEGFVSLSSIVSGLMGFTPVLLNGLYAEQYPTAVITVLNGTATNAQNAGAVADFLIGTLVSNTAGVTGGETLLTDFADADIGATAGLPTATYNPLTLVAAVAAAAAPNALIGTVITATTAGDATAFFTALGATALHASITQTLTPEAAAVGALAATSSTFSAFLFDGLGFTTVAERSTFNFTTTEAILTFIQGVSPSVETGTALAVLGECIGDTTATDCTVPQIVAATDLTQDNVLCTLAATGFPSLVLPGPPCTTADLLVAISAPAFLASGALDLSSLTALIPADSDITLEQALAIVSNLFPLCAATGSLTTFGACQTRLLDLGSFGDNGDGRSQQAGLPDDFTAAGYSLCLTSTACNFTSGETSLAKFAEGLAASEDPASQLGGGLLLTCLGVGATTRAACFGAAAANPAAFAATTGFAIATNFLDPDADGSFVAACEDDEEDARRIGLAQALVPAAIGFEVVGLLLAVVSIMQDKKVLCMVAGVVCLGGGVLTLTALLQVQGAPVYENVGGDPVDEEPLYASGTAQLLGLIGILTPILGGITLIVAAALGGDGADGTVSGKVEGTY